MRKQKRVFILLLIQLDYMPVKGLSGSKDCLRKQKPSQETVIHLRGWLEIKPSLGLSSFSSKGELVRADTVVFGANNRTPESTTDALQAGKYSKTH